MKCFLRTNSLEIREALKKNGLTVCICAEFEKSEWLTYAPNAPYNIHGVYPAEDDEPEAYYFGNKDTFKEIFLANNKDFIDCGEDVEFFIRTIKR